MMAKIVKGAGFKGTVNYILDPKKGTTILDADGVRLKSKASIIQSFVAQAKLKPSLGKSVGHISLNFSVQDKDKLTNEMMVKVVREYMLRMKITNTQYILARHFDKEHPHVHLCFNRVDNNGKTISDNNDRYRSEKICKELTAKYGLYLSSGKENVKTQRLREPDKTKYEIYYYLNALVPKCKTWNQLLHNLNRYGVDSQFKYKGQTGEIQGITFTKNGYSFTGSKVDRMLSYSKIDYQLKQNVFSLNQTQNKSQQQSPTKDIIESTLDALSGIGSMQVHGDDYEEEAFKDRMEYEEEKRKKKRQFRPKF
ncbi:relaxase/mobilization nuclease domain-containing protein [Dysgonomonas sp. GY617]|uniref:relaxase/mobilization nuclease domain-containing protein n=1 Tax=Dysgonomonas sp. GY617 TaxID=2780420 RepID=UPI001883B65C|nr:relaxase/mobilization nuclease domain-containing protein [Dysgonomonas sp. GY617]MBF0577562.1 relaxase/mobilization nuclease domain-containing protein [Dysgonomonas sp. GY617]